MNISDLQALDLISRLPDNAPLTVEEAAVFLRVSPSTLNKMRMPGHPTGGPVYSQAGKKGTGGSNQKVLYLKRDLVAWLEENKVSNTLEAAVRKGQMFVTAADLAEERPYWVNEAGLIAGSVWDTSADLLVARIVSPLWSVAWLDATEACLKPWSGIMAKRVLVGAVERALSDILGGVRGALERDEFENEARGTDKTIVREI